MSAWADNPQAAQIDALIERANRLMQDEKNALIDSFWWLDRISLGALYDELWGVATTAIEMAGRGVQLSALQDAVEDAHMAVDFALASLLGRDLICESADWDQAAYDCGTAPWAKAIGPAHPDDVQAPHD